MLKKEEIQKIADLSRLDLSDEEMDGLGKDLSSILDYFKTLEEVDTSKVNPTYHSFPDKNIVREDKEEDFKERERILADFPEKEGPYIKVKEILK